MELTAIAYPVLAQRFAEHCLPRHFKHNKLATFQQQLQTYGFKKVANVVPHDKSAVWSHPNFRQHQQAMLVHITRDPMRRAHDAMSVLQPAASPFRPFSPSVAAEFGQAMDLASDDDEDGEGGWAPDMATLHADVRRMCGSINTLRQQLDRCAPWQHRCHPHS